MDWEFGQGSLLVWIKTIKYTKYTIFYSFYSSYSCLLVHICMKVEIETKMEPPVQTETGWIGSLRGNLIKLVRCPSAYALGFQKKRLPQKYQAESYQIWCEASSQWRLVRLCFTSEFALPTGAGRNSLFSNPGWFLQIVCQKLSCRMRWLLWELLEHIQMSSFTRHSDYLSRYR